jgi:hypothetical protein
MNERPPPWPERVRRIGEGSFAFIPHRFLRDGFFASLTETERSLYLFLTLAADRQGVSFYGYDRICSTLEVPLESYLAARNGLMDKDLVAFDGHRFQVLSLPERPLWPRSRPLVTEEELEREDGATIRAVLARSLDEES